MTEIILHIGMNKTGTSALQRFMAQNRRALLRMGLLYPNTGLGTAHEGMDRHYFLSKALGFAPVKTGGAPDPAQRNRMRLDLRAEIAASRADTVLLSSENFVRKGDLAPVREFFAPDAVKILVYLRRHDDWWGSFYAQAVQTVAAPPWGEGIEAFRRYQKARGQLHLAYVQMLDHWAKVFGTENIIVRPYEAEQNQPSLVHDMLRAIDAPKAAFELPVEPTRVNASLPSGAVLMLDAVQRAAVSERARREIIDAIRARRDSFPDDPFILAKTRRQIVANNARQYESIARIYLGREDGVLFRAPLPEADDDTVARPPSSAEVIQFFAEDFVGRRRLF